MQTSHTDSHHEPGRKSALDWLMQVLSLAVVLLVVGAGLANMRAAEKNGAPSAALAPVEPTPLPAPATTASSPSPTAKVQALARSAPQRTSQTVAPQSLPAIGLSVAPQPTALWPAGVFTSMAELLVSPPPNEEETASELDQLRTLAGQRGPATRAAIQYWHAGSPSYRWVEMALQQAQSSNLSLSQTARVLALLDVAVYDALTATRYAAVAYDRTCADDMDPALPAIAAPRAPCYPDEHAAVAGAATAVLSSLFPQQAALFADMAQNSVQARLLAGVAFPSDVQAGRSLGQAVAERVLAARPLLVVEPASSGSAPSASWDALSAHGQEFTTWMPWTLEYAGEFLPPPPSSDTLQVSRDDRQQMENILASATADAREKALIWGSFAGVYDYWYTFATQKLGEYHIDDSAIEAGRVYALLSVAQDDAVNACWQAMQTYRVLRPADASAAAFINQQPSYPSIHACLAGATSGILTAVFPADAAAINVKAQEAAQAGLWIGGALPSDVQAGYTLGRTVALKVLSSPLPWPPLQ